jgi:hypothetical protein
VLTLAEKAARLTALNERDIAAHTCPRREIDAGDAWLARPYAERVVIVAKASKLKQAIQGRKRRLDRWGYTPWGVAMLTLSRRVEVSRFGSTSQSYLGSDARGAAQRREAPHGVATGPLRHGASSFGPATAGQTGDEQ